MKKLVDNSVVYDWFKARFEKVGGVNLTDLYRELNYKVNQDQVEAAREKVEKEFGLRFEYSRFCYVPSGTTEDLLRKGYTVY